MTIQTTDAVKEAQVFERKVKADHEAGHYIAACMGGFFHMSRLLTIRGNDAIGGACILAPDSDDPATPEQWAVWAAGGMAGQAYGFMVEHGRDPTVEESDRIKAGAIGDVEHIRKLLGQEVDVQTYYDRAFAIVCDNWLMFEALSQALQDNGSLYHNEPALIMLAMRDRQPLINASLAVYREHRLSVDISGPEFAWLKESHPGVPWFESPDEFRQREGCKDIMQFPQWFAEKMGFELDLSDYEMKSREAVALTRAL